MKRAVRLTGQWLLLLLAVFGVLGASSGCVLPDDVAKSAATNAANSAVRYFFQLLPQSLDELRAM